VERAIEIVEVALAHCAASVYVRKQIVHNTHAVANLENTPVESMALTCAVIRPSGTADRLFLSTRMALWTYAIDDYVDVCAQSVQEVDETITLCCTRADR
jgi:hypothetical protein